MDLFFLAGHVVDDRSGGSVDGDVGDSLGIGKRSRLSSTDLFFAVLNVAARKNDFLD